MLPNYDMIIAYEKERIVYYMKRSIDVVSQLALVHSRRKHYCYYYYCCSSGAVKGVECARGPFLFFFLKSSCTAQGENGQGARLFYYFMRLWGSFGDGENATHNDGPSRFPCVSDDGCDFDATGDKFQKCVFFDAKNVSQGGMCEVKPIFDPFIGLDWVITCGILVMGLAAAGVVLAAEVSLYHSSLFAAGERLPPCALSL